MNRIKHLIALGFMFFLLVYSAYPSYKIITSNDYTFSEQLTIATLAGSVLCLLFSIYKWVPKFTTLLIGTIALGAHINLLLLKTLNSFLNANLLFLAGETEVSLSYTLLTSLPSSFWLITAAIIFMTLYCMKFPAYEIRLPWKMMLGISAVFFVFTGVHQFQAFQAELERNGPFTDKGDFDNGSTHFVYGWLYKNELVRNIYPVSLFFNIKDYYYERQEMIRFADLQAEHTFSAKPDSKPSNDRKIVILVIGETSRFDHWGINGYARDTSPILDQTPNLISFQHMYAYAGITRYSVPVILTRKPMDEITDYYHEASIITFFKEIGFDTHWISLTAFANRYDTPISVYSYEADHVQFINFQQSDFKPVPDYTAISYVQDILNANDHDVFIVIHTLGSHYQYADRYEEDMRIFTPDRYADRQPDIYNKADEEVLVNAYDNSIYATDYFLGNLIQTLDSYSAASMMFYISDHGEGLYDDGQEFFGHGYSSFATLHIPAFFWGSEQFITANQAKIDNLLLNQHKLTTTSMVFETLASLSGGTLPDARPFLDMTQNELIPPQAMIERLREIQVILPANALPEETHSPSR